MAAAPPAITNPQAGMPALRRRGPLLLLYLFFTHFAFWVVKLNGTDQRKAHMGAGATREDLYRFFTFSLPEFRFAG